MFPLLSEHFEASPQVDITEIIIQYLSQLSIKLDLYFPADPRPRNLWIQNPFSVYCATKDVTLPLRLENDLIELSEDSGLKLHYQKVDLPFGFRPARNTLHCLSALLCFSYHSLLLTCVNRVSRQLLQRNRRYETVSKLIL